MARTGALTCSDAPESLGVAAAPPAVPGIPHHGDPPCEDDTAVDEVPECLHMIQVAIGMPAEGGRANESDHTNESAANPTPPGTPRASILADFAGYRLTTIMRRAWSAASSPSESWSAFSTLDFLLVFIVLAAVVWMVMRKYTESEAQPDVAEFARPPSAPRSRRGQLVSSRSCSPPPSLVGATVSFVQSHPFHGGGDSSVMSSVSHSGTPGPPIIYQALTTPTKSTTRLAVPVEALTKPSFSVDVLSTTGIVLTAFLNERVSPDIMIRASIGTLIAVVDPKQQISTADGAVVGTLVRGLDPKTYALCDPWGRELLSVAVVDGTPELSMYTHCSGQKTECARVRRRGPAQGRVPKEHCELTPKEHYELTVNPGVDSMLVTACLLGLVRAGISDEC